VTIRQRRIQLELSEAEYAQLVHIAKERDCSVRELIYQVVRQTLIGDLEDNATTIQVQHRKSTPGVMRLRRRI